MSNQDRCMIETFLGGRTFAVAVCSYPYDRQESRYNQAAACPIVTGSEVGEAALGLILSETDQKSALKIYS